jgi:hypothetical protein
MPDAMWKPRRALKGLSIIAGGKQQRRPGYYIHPLQGWNSMFIFLVDESAEHIFDNRQSHA